MSRLMVLLLVGTFTLPQTGHTQPKDNLLPNEPLIILHRDAFGVKASCETAAFVVDVPFCKSPVGLPDGTCLEMKALVAICNSSPRVLFDEVRGFEDEVLTQLRVNSGCNGVVIAPVEPDSPFPTNLADRVWASARTGDGLTWGLTIDVNHGARTQSWAMITPGSTSPMKGEGDPKTIAGDICSIVTGRGARSFN
jgi:hypothetical protein